MLAFQADEHVPQEVITGLNARGIEVYSAYHEGLSGKSDEEVFEYAQRKSRIIRDVARLIDTSQPMEFENNVFYLPRNR